MVVIDTRCLICFDLNVANSLREFSAAESGFNCIIIDRINGEGEGHRAVAARSRLECINEITIYSRLCVSIEMITENTFTELVFRSLTDII